VCVERGRRARSNFCASRGWRKGVAVPRFVFFKTSPHVRASRVAARCVVAVVLGARPERRKARRASGAPLAAIK
jgi:hypothetical protein